MARPKCRCGQELEIPSTGAEHVTCPRCSARVRLIRKPASGAEVGDGFIRFSCPCGRRLKVSAIDRPTHGKCPDCDRVVPVPVGAGLPSASSLAESPTEELSTTDRATLEAWTKSHIGPKSTGEMPSETAPRRGGEAGLRVCPQCGKPIHLGADACRTCGVSVPRR